MNVSLTAELERWVAAKVKAGRYKSASEVVREGLRLLQEKEEHVARLEALRRDIGVGLDELDRGQGIDGEAAFDRVLARVSEREESAA